MRIVQDESRAFTMRKQAYSLLPRIISFIPHFDLRNSCKLVKISANLGQTTGRQGVTLGKYKFFPLITGKRRKVMGKRKAQYTIHKSIILYFIFNHANPGLVLYNNIDSAYKWYMELPWKSTIFQ